jgi:hypothetical protein
VAITLEEDDVLGPGSGKVLGIGHPETPYTIARSATQFAIFFFLRIRLLGLGCLPLIITSCGSMRSKSDNGGISTSVESDEEEEEDEIGIKSS